MMPMQKQIELQKADAEADAVLFEISGAVCRCRFHPYVAQRGLFRILLGPGK
jgi:hypothetical protein